MMEKEYELNVDQSTICAHSIIVINWVLFDNQTWLMLDYNSFHFHNFFNRSRHIIYSSNTYLSYCCLGPFIFLINFDLQFLLDKSKYAQ